MGGGPIIIIDPNKVKSNLSQEETIARLREAADALESGELNLDAEEEG